MKRVLGIGALALLGLVAAVAISLAASNLSSQPIGISDEPLDAGEQLVVPSPTATPERDDPSPEATPDETRSPSGGDDDRSGEDSSGSGSDGSGGDDSGRGRGRGRGRGGGDDD